MFWIFNKYARWKLRRLRNLDFKMDNLTKRIKGDVLEEMKSEMKNFSKLDEIERKLDVKRHKLNVIGKFRDQFGKEKLRSFPIFTENEIQEIKSQRRLYIFLLVLFVLSETFLYYLTAEIIVPIDSMFVKLIIGLIMAVLVFLLFDFFLKAHFLNREVNERREELGFTDKNLKKYKDKLIIGYAALFVAVFFMIAASIVRYYYLHGTDTTGLNPDEIEKTETLGMWVNYLIIAFTIGVALYLGPLKVELLKTINEYKVYKRWRHTIIRLNNMIQHARKIINNHYNKLNHLMEINWHLVLSLKEIFGIEYDQKQNDLFQEFDYRKKNSRLVIDKDTYNHYEEIQCADEQLFKFGILNDKYLTEWDYRIAALQIHIIEVDNHLKNISDKVKS
ncbi:MAG: hypothetical protein SGI89_03135 [bacterium]|nr:hypothetical protein [bacterium]